MALTVDPAHSVAQLTRVLGEHTGCGAITTVAKQTQAGREVLDPTAKLGQVGLLYGDVLYLDPAPDSADDGDSTRSGQPASTGQESIAPLEIVVCAGPETGRVIPITRTPSSAGRDHGNEIVLAKDRRIARQQFSIVAPSERQLLVFPNAHKRNPTRVNGVRIDDPHELRHGDRLTVGRTTLLFRSVSKPDQQLPVAVGRVEFTPKRTASHLPPQRIFEAIAIPSRVGMSLFALALTALVIVAAAALSFVTDQIWFMALMLAAPLPFLLGRQDEGYSRFASYEKKSVEFDVRSEQRANEIRSAVVVERSMRLEAWPDLAALEEAARLRTPLLWSRSLQDRFLDLRVGSGKVPSLIRVETGQIGGFGEGDAMQRHLDSVDWEELADMPIHIDLVSNPLLTLTGDEVEISALATAMVVQACSLHNPNDLSVMAITNRSHRFVEWLPWAPQTHPGQSPIRGKPLRFTADEGNALLLELLELAQGRRRLTNPLQPWILLVVDETVGCDPELLSQLSTATNGGGLTIVRLAPGPAREGGRLSLSLQCEAGDSGERSSLWRSSDQVGLNFNHDVLDPGTASRICRTLAPLQVVDRPQRRFS